MKYRYIRFCVICIAVVIVAFLLVNHFSHIKRTTTSSQKKSFFSLHIHNRNYSLEVADTEAERVQGLSDRMSLGTSSVMIFIFPQPDVDSMWMKDMHFALDMIWLDSSFKVVHIEENATPQSFPEIFSSPTPALYVLETNSGFVKENGVKISDIINIK